jgi:hypothetical protein
MTRNRRNLGFDGRQFLLEAEWTTYRRRKPVRYIRKPKASTCEVCGRQGTAADPLQNAHVIGFDVGVVDLALTPEYLDSDENIITAHRKTCNRASELDLAGSMKRLKGLGVRELPAFLPDTVHESWKGAEGERPKEEEEIDLVDREGLTEAQVLSDIASRGIKATAREYGVPEDWLSGITSDKQLAHTILDMHGKPWPVPTGPG